MTTAEAIAQKCPCCGAAVRVVGKTTQHYEPIPDHSLEAEIERLRAVVEAARPVAAEKFGEIQQRPFYALCEALAALEEPEDDVGPPAPGEGGDLENPEIGMKC